MTLPLPGNARLAGADTFRRTARSIRRAKAKIEAQQSSPELSAIHLVRKRSDLTEAMPRFVTAYLEAQLSA